MASLAASGLSIVPPPASLNATGTTLTLWMRFDTFPNNPVGGILELYAQDANWGWNAAQYNISTFALSTWKQLTLALPAAGNWTSVKALGLRVSPGGTGCQSATMYIDSVQLE